jgi:alkanesulfonate monooxygenase SsuD/methylene tetrahydromethanopterin reductase-like flavin-dependent oxidoreductase (luciferase family)
LSYGLNPAEARDRTTEAMELVLKAWTEPQPFGWQGRHFQFRMVAVWPRPLQQPHPPTYALGGSLISCEFAARHHLGLGVAYAPFEAVGKVTRYYRDACNGFGWQPAPEQIIYRANILLAATDEEAQDLMKIQRAAVDVPAAPSRSRKPPQLDPNMAGERRPAMVGGVLPTNFLGGRIRSLNRSSVQ